MTTSPKKQPLSKQASAWFYAHPHIASIGFTILIVCAGMAIFYIAAFSDISSSADFIYSTF